MRENIVLFDEKHEVYATEIIINSKESTIKTSTNVKEAMIILGPEKALILMNLLNCLERYKFRQSQYVIKFIPENLESSN